MPAPPRRRRLRLAAALLSLGVAVLAGELLLRRVRPQPTYSRMKGQVVSIWRPGEDLPFRLAPDARLRVTDMGGEFGAAVSTNSLGYRDEEFSRDKPRGTLRLLAVGDSQTFGYGVGDQETWPERLEEQLRAGSPGPVEVINGGYAGGSAPDHYLVYLRREGLGLQPDLVVIAYFVYNDFSDLVESEWTRTDARGRPERIRSRYRWINDDGVRFSRSTRLRYRIPLLRDSHLFLLLSRSLGPKLFDPPPPDRENWHHDFAMFREHMGPELEASFARSLDCMSGIGEEVERAGARLLVVLLPADLQIYPGQAAKYTRGARIEPPDDVLTSTWPQARIVAALEARGIATVDLLPAFRLNRSTRVYFDGDPHLNAIGHRVVARYVEMELRARGWL